MKQRVFVGMSGGVDSSVAAAGLKARGYEVVGVFIKVWQPDFIDCHWEEERLDAMRVAAHLDIPFLTCDAEAAYKQQVADYFIAEYAAGRTPNPDVLCNKAVKFGAFYDFAMARGADYVATGHYAQLVVEGSERSFLRGIDRRKDQSYFLWQIPRERLEKTLFPVGGSPKDEIRKEATSLGLPVATKKDSQGICFLGHIDIPEFLSHYIDLAPGDVLSERGEIIGTHKGAQVYTVGQRHGFSINTATTSESAHYVVSRDLSANTITVSGTPPQQEGQSEIHLTAVNLFCTELPKKVSLQFRYQQQPLTATVVQHDINSLELIIEETHDQPSPGQSCVLYDGEFVLGGGIIS